MAKKSYHHGNLRETLVVAALEILANDGLDGVSLRKVALKAGVSATALYTHFNDKRELLALMASQGFTGLSKSMLKGSNEVSDKAVNTGSNKTPNKLLNLAQGYVFFAIENPSLFQLMFGNQLSNLAEFPDLAEASANSYTIMTNAVAEQIEEKGKQTNPKIGAAAAWSMMHGLSTLINDGKISPKSSGVNSIDELIQKVGGTLIFV